MKIVRLHLGERRHFHLARGRKIAQQQHVTEAAQTSLEHVGRAAQAATASPLPTEGVDIGEAMTLLRKVGELTERA